MGGAKRYPSSAFDEVMGIAALNPSYEMDLAKIASEF
jgi:hypothetical protein